MKELFVALSHYNQKANDAVFAKLSVMTADQLAFPMRAYYRTIVDTVFHVMKSDVKWLSRLEGLLPSRVESDVLDPYTAEGSVDVGLVAAKLPDFIETRRRIDDAMIAVVAAIPADAFLADYEIQFGPGTITRPLWQLLMQWFNHHTHHRGQVSVQLDALGIDNDFSGVLDKIG